MTTDMIYEERGSDRSYQVSAVAMVAVWPGSAKGVACETKGSCGSSFSGYKLQAEVEIQVKEGGASLNETFREANLVLKG